MWSALAWPGTEHVAIREGPEAIEVDGLVVADVDSGPFRLRYRIDPDYWDARTA